MVHHRIICGDSATFQGDERDIVFLSMIADRNRKQSRTAMQYAQRFNVALSRARDRMVLVRSVTEEDLNPNDLKARIIRHFHEPMPEMADASAAPIDLCQSGFERDLFSVLIESGYRVIPQVGSEGFSIDMVVEGESGRRLAIECDGDLYHGPERWADDIRRQRILERVGWTFWRCFGSNYSLDRGGVLDDLFQTLDRMDIKQGWSCCCTVATDITRWCASRRCCRVSSDCTVRALSMRMLAMICRLLATRCCIS
jgi:very-short-patch-repair endonuclease